MKRVRGHGGRGDVPGKLQIEWSGVSKPAAVRSTSPLPAPDSSQVVQRLKWDFKTTFPLPTPEAIEAGIVGDEDGGPRQIRAIHEEHARELLSVLHHRETLRDARRKGVDLRNDKVPALLTERGSLQRHFEIESARLENWWRIQMETYEEAFGQTAANAFGKAIHAWHAGIAVERESVGANIVVPTDLPPLTHRHIRRTKPLRISARLPVPKPLPSAVAAGHFGQEENGRQVRPGPHEVRAITEQLAEKLIDLLDSIASAPVSEKNALLESFQNGVNAYAEDFGQPPAKQLEAYVRRQAGLDHSSRNCR